MLELTIKTNTIETIGNSSIRITIPKDLREDLGVDINDFLYIGLPDKELQELSILEISPNKVDSVRPVRISSSGRIGIDNSLSNLSDISSYKKIGLASTKNKIFLFFTNAMKKDIEENKYTEEDRKEIREKATMIAEIVEKAYK